MQSIILSCTNIELEYWLCSHTPEGYGRQGQKLIFNILNPIDNQDPRKSTGETTVVHVTFNNFVILTFEKQTDQTGEITKNAYPHRRIVNYKANYILTTRGVI